MSYYIKDYFQRGYWVYIHTCPDGKKYVGCTARTQPEFRWGKDGRRYSFNSNFYSAILKYGWDNIKHEVWEFTSESEMYYAEKYLITYYDTTNPERGYNRFPGGKFLTPIKYKWRFPDGSIREMTTASAHKNYIRKKIKLVRLDKV